MTEHTAPDSTDRNDLFLRSRRYARECALQILYQADLQQEWELTAATILQYWEQIEAMDSMPLDCEPRQVQALTERLVQGVVSELATIDERLHACAANWRIDRMGVIDRNILRLATYEIIRCDDIPPLASLNEAIELAKEFGDKDSARFVNGVLDKVLRDSQADQT